jgi:integrase
MRQTARQFHLHRRKGVFYVQFINPQTKERLTALSTRKTSRDEALIVVYDWLKNGIPRKRPQKEETETSQPLNVTLHNAQILSELKKAELTKQDVFKIGQILSEKGLIRTIILQESPEAESFEDFLTRFWDYDRSPYVEEKLSHKLRIGRTHTKLCLERAKKYWLPYFRERSLGEITLQDLKDFSVALSNNNPNLSALTLKHILLVGTAALRWAYNNKKIPLDPTGGLCSFSSKSKRRGILKPPEVVALFKLRWNDQRALLANILAMSTGMRIGEILALRTEDIGDEYISVQNSYSRLDGLKCTKTDEERIVPVIPEIRDALRHLARKNPHDNRFIFFCEKPDRPWDQEMPALALKKMLIKMVVGDRPPQRAPQKDIEAWEAERDKAKEYWKKRNIVFHSWRHFYASELSKRLKARQIMPTTGHKTESVFWEYAGHVLDGDMAELAQTQNQVFGTLLPEIPLTQDNSKELMEVQA